MVPVTGSQQPSNVLKSFSDTETQSLANIELTTKSLTVSDAAAAPTIKLNVNAAKFVKEYLKKNNGDLQKIEDRSTPYFKIIDAAFTKQGLPVELKYLAIVESELNRNAVSKAGAVGPWQLMPVTARELGLKVSRKYDERKNYYKSSEAVARYLKYLYSVYGDWLLVIAAYNVGPGNIDKAIKKAGSRNFWRLQQYLPAETRGHVKRFIGIHYYFEDGGSVTTLTKAEKEHYMQLCNSYNKARDCEKEERKAVTINQPAGTVPEREIVVKTEPLDAVKMVKEK